MVFGLLRQRSPGGSSQDDSENSSAPNNSVEMRRVSQQTLENESVEQTLQDDSVEGLVLADELPDLSSSSSEGDPNKPDTMENGPPPEPLTSRRHFKFIT